MRLSICLCKTRRRQSESTLFPYTTLFRSPVVAAGAAVLDDDVSELSSLPQAAKTSAETATSTRTARAPRSEEHTSELQSHVNLVCRLLLEKKNINSKFKSLDTITVKIIRV